MKPTPKIDYFTGLRNLKNEIHSAIELLLKKYEAKGYDKITGDTLNTGERAVWDDFNLSIDTDCNVTGIKSDGTLIYDSSFMLTADEENKYNYTDTELDIYDALSIIDNLQNFDAEYCKEQTELFETYPTI